MHMDPKHPLKIHYEFYPPESLRAHEQGKCTIALFVDQMGFIRGSQLRQSTGFPRLDAACLISVQGQRMLPATLNGQPLGTWTVIPITWSTEGKAPGPPPPEFSGPEIHQDYELQVGPQFYPPDAQARKETGVCAVWVSVNPEGHVAQSKVIKSTGSASLDKACMEAVSPAQFTPAKKDGVAVNAGTLLALYWTL